MNTSFCWAAYWPWLHTQQRDWPWLQTHTTQRLTMATNTLNRGLTMATNTHNTGVDHGYKHTQQRVDHGYKHTQHRSWPWLQTHTTEGLTMATNTHNRGVDHGYKHTTELLTIATNTQHLFIDHGYKHTTELMTMATNTQQLFTDHGYTHTHNRGVDHGYKHIQQSYWPRLQTTQQSYWPRLQTTQQRNFTNRGQFQTAIPSKQQLHLKTIIRIWMTIERKHVFVWLYQCILYVYVSVFWPKYAQSSRFPLHTWSQHFCFLSNTQQSNKVHKQTGHTVPTSVLGATKQVVQALKILHTVSSWAN